MKLLDTFFAGCRVETDVEFQGSAVFYTGTNQSFSWEDCQDMCRDRGNKYFVWAGPKYNQNKCYCKDGYTSSHSYVSIVSGEANSCSGKIGKLGGLSILKCN